MKENFSNLARYIGDYRRSVENPEAYWDEIASTFLWHQRWEKTLEWDFHKPEVKWFVGGKLNITENCLDRHLITKANKVAIIWESNFVDEP
ncbi:MAG: acetyl-coenzyme A synthetase, partial [Flammeovirgaceae bacterium]|nr:acetyl-coenzyme A synthetase [Flammeovirgaceae bacterium]